MNYFKCIDARIIFKIMIANLETRMNVLVKKLLCTQCINLFRFQGFRIPVLKIGFMLCAQTVKLFLIDYSSQGNLKT